MAATDAATASNPAADHPLHSNVRIFSGRKESGISVSINAAIIAWSQNLIGESDLRETALGTKIAGRLRNKLDTLRPIAKERTRKR